MTSKHTAGPWHRNIRANGKYPIVFSGRNLHVAQIMQQTEGSETEANIDLVAAAPELLEALEDAVANYITVVANHQQTSLKEIKADPVVKGWLEVIAKAKGGA